MSDIEIFSDSDIYKILGIGLIILLIIVFFIFKVVRRKLRKKV